MPISTITLNDGRKIPGIAYGSWTLGNGREVIDQVEQGLDVGFDHLDTAQVYRNEEEVGVAFKESGLARDDVWITSKWSGLWMGEKQMTITDSCKASLAKIGVEYLDLYLIHSASLVKGRINEAWAEMEDLQKAGLVRSIGVSNFKVDDLKVLLHKAKVVPAVNQILLHPYVYEQTKDLLEFMHEKHIVPEAYSALIPLTKQPGGPLDKPLEKIAKAHNLAPEQVLLAWVLSKNAVAVTTSSKRDRLERYLASGDVKLSHHEIEALEKAGAKGPPKTLGVAQKVALGVVCMVLGGAAGWYRGSF